MKLISDNFIKLTSKSLNIQIVALSKTRINIWINFNICLHMITTLHVCKIICNTSLLDGPFIVTNFAHHFIQNYGMTCCFFSTVIF